MDGGITMYNIIVSTLNRQDKALDLMKELLQEEFSLLMKRDTDAIMTIEFSIHELLRQLATEKESIIKTLGGGRLKDYAQMLPEEQRETIISLWMSIDGKEQACAKQASLNTRLSLGLLDQSKDLLNYLHERILPPQRTNYSRRGTYAKLHPQASVLSARY